MELGLGNIIWTFEQFNFPKKFVFIEKIMSTGIELSNLPIKIIKINEEISYSDGERFIKIKPSTLSLPKPRSVPFNHCLNIYHLLNFLDTLPSTSK